MADSGRVLEARPGEQGCLAYGPYLKLEKGSYRVIYEIEIEEPDGITAGSLDVYVDKERVYAHRQLKKLGRGRQFYELNFKVAKDGSGPFEFRVHSFGRGIVKLYSVELLRVK